MGLIYTQSKENLQKKCPFSKYANAGKEKDEIKSPQHLTQNETSHLPSNEVISSSSVPVPDCDLQHLSCLLEQMQVKQLPPLWIQCLRYCLHTQKKKHVHISGVTKLIQPCSLLVSVKGHNVTLLLYFWCPSLNFAYGSLSPFGSMGVRFRPSIRAILTIPRHSWAFRCKSERRTDCCCWSREKESTPLKPSFKSTFNRLHTGHCSSNCWDYWTGSWSATDSSPLISSVRFCQIFSFSYSFSVSREVGAYSNWACAITRYLHDY